MVTLKEQIDNCPEFGTLVLKGDVSEAVVITNRTLTIDMAGFTMSAPENKPILTVKGKGHITLKNGKMASTAAPCVHIEGTDDGKAVVTLSTGVTLFATTYSAVVVGKDAEVRTYADISCTGNYGAIQRSFAEPARPTLLHVFGGSIISAESSGILWPTNGCVEIHQGTVSGVTGIEMRAGILKVHAGKIIGTAASSTSVSNKTGAAVTGAGIAVSQLSDEYAVSIEVYGGTISGATPLMDVNPEGLTAGRKDVDISVVGGEFTITGSGSASVSSVDQVDFIIEGSFSKAPAKEFVAIGTSLEQKGGMTKASRPLWNYPEGGAVGVGFTGNRRLVFHIDKVNYPTGGFKMTLYGFKPVALVSANAVGGVVPYFDMAKNVVHLYRKGVELTGQVEDLTIVLIGN